ncbi:hypothetical protein [Streptomyces sp. GESEQ-4]|uniref:hypothetical protein n=1 Tax=Streptomyces sp. GESEQ-4 TaxID=2812655 RepID=UPI001FF0ADA1|nr:hypothetical protein [Streptomyces sp. GESEQ-4]
MAAASGLSDGSTPLMARRRAGVEVLAGEETALVRPYVLASEEWERQRSTAPASTWYVPEGAF